MLIIVIAFFCARGILYKTFPDATKAPLIIDKFETTQDENKNGISDIDDLIIGARKEITDKPIYKSAYYAGGYPPSTEGVCTDIIWRALKNAGYDLKALMDKDIKDNPKAYSASIKVPDPNIDFRRVKNQYIFFKRFATSLPTEVIPYDKENLYTWQRGDIVVLANPEHIAMISDTRKNDGVPLVLHHANLNPREEDYLLAWNNSKRIIGHFRFPTYPTTQSG